MLYAFNPSTQEAEAGLFELKTSLVYTASSRQVGALKIYFYLYEYVCLESPVCASARESQKNVSDVPGAGVTDNHEPSNVGAGSQRLSLCKRGGEHS